MKKIFTLLVTMCVALCTYADDLTFSVAVDGYTITVTPSDPEQLYMCAPIDDKKVAYFSYLMNTEINIDTPDLLFRVAQNMYSRYLFTGTSTQTCYNGHFYLLMCGAKVDKLGEIHATTPITVQELTLGDDTGEEGPELEPLTFTFESDNDSFTITPSDDSREYLAYPFAPDQVEKLQSLPVTFDQALEEYLRMFVSFDQAQGHTDKGVVRHLYHEYLDEGEEPQDGVYLVALVGIKTEGSRQSIVPPIYTYDWVVTFDTEGIHNIDATNSIFKLGKVYKDGKILINGRVNLNGVLAR